MFTGRQEVPLRSIRESLYVSREDLARATQSVSIGTIRRAERGEPVRPWTANELLIAINRRLREKGRAEAALDDLGLTIVGYASSDVA